MTLYRRSIAILVMLSVVTIVAFGGGFQLNEHGARGMAQAGAFAARAADGSAIFFNPAGLGFQQGTSFMAGTTLIAMAGKFTSLKTSAATEMVSQTFFPSNAYLTHTMANGLAFGVGFFNPYGLGTEWPMDWEGRRLAVKTDLKTYYINPTVAYRLSEQFSIGVGVSYIISNVALKYRVPTYSSFAPPTPASSDGSAELTGDGHAINWNVGLSWKPTPELYVGASYRAKAKIDYDGDVKFTNMQVLQGLFPGGSGKTSITLPSNLFAGVAYAFTPHLTVEGDFQMIGWSSYDELKVDIATGPAAPALLGGQPLQKSPTPQKKGWKDAYMFRVGGEYAADPFAIRAGFIYDKTPQPDQKIEPMLPDANRVEFTVGLGFKVLPFMGIDVAYQVILFQERSVPVPDNGLGGTYKNSANLVGMDLNFAI
jgi:long-chain fatty acid transport protein